MIKGLGNDIIEIARINGVLKRHGQCFLDKVFTLNEQKYCLLHHDSEKNFAGRFAAKEAIVKALGCGLKNGISWLDFEILNDTRGKPIVHLSSHIQKQFANPTIHISISHCKTYATAVAIYL